MLQDDRYIVAAETDSGSSTASQFLSEQMASPPQLDSDAIKMFIGQIPKSMEEDDLKKFLEDFGPVHDLNILRDRQTGQSKGCAFVTFCARKDALAAQMALHNLKIMPGLSHPVQMKPADGQMNSVEERRLFVGMLSKKLTEADVTMMFAAYGTIDDCVVLKDAKGESKGCAFVTFGNKHCAQAAIKSMHHSQTMEGCKLPLVVKIADTQKDKDIKRFYQSQQQQQQQQHSFPSIPGQATQQTSQYLSMLQQALPNSNLASLAALGNVGTAGMNQTQLQQFMVAAAALAPLLQSNPGLAAVLAALGSTSPALPNSAASTAPNLALLQQLAAVTTGNQMNASNTVGASNTTANMFLSSCGMDTMPQFPSAASPPGSLQSTGFGSGSSGFCSSMSGFGASSNSSLATASSSSSSTDLMNKAYSGFQQYMAGLPNTLPAVSQSPASPANNQSKGPEGANLFIYHLPREFRDPDLAQMFLPFGAVISAKVFIDKNTNQSKCFGFVSFENPLSAQSAIQAMNGFQIGSKRLKVSLKNSKADSKPY